MRGTVAIIGGGIGGLAASIALRDGGWDVTLFEREAWPSGAGTALGMWPSALKALDRVGVGHEVRAAGVAQHLARFVRPDVTTIAELDGNKLARRSGDPVYLLSRPALLDLLRKAAPSTALRFAEPVDDVTALMGGHDLVVAADGIFSHTRSQLFGDGARARYTGQTAWRGFVEHQPTDTLTEAWGAGAKFGVTPQEGDRTNWYATTVAPEGSTKPGRELALLHELFGSWQGPVSTVLAAITDDGILRHDLYATPKLSTYVRANVALIGDAAHAMSPDLGRGACEALIDAVALADCLRDSPTVADGLRSYDRQRRRTTQAMAATAAAAARLTRWTRRLWLRDAILRASLLLPPPA